MVVTLASSSHLETRYRNNRGVFYTWNFHSPVWGVRVGDGVCVGVDMDVCVGMDMGRG